MPYVSGTLKTNKLQIQGHGAYDNSDLEMSVSDSTFVMSMGSNILLEVAPDGAGEFNNATNDTNSVLTIMKDTVIDGTLQVNNDATFEGDVVVHGAFSAPSLGSIDSNLGNIANSVTSIESNISSLDTLLANLRSSFVPEVLQTYVATESTSNIQDAAEAVWIYCYPLFVLQSIALQGKFVLRVDNGVNRWNSINIDLASANRSVSVSAPNTDTIYQLINLDLTTGPFTLAIPDSTDISYFSFEFFDLHGDCVGLVSKRTNGTKATVYRVFGPNQLGYGPDIIRVPNNYTTLLLRVGVTNDPLFTKVTPFINSIKNVPITLPTYSTKLLSNPLSCLPGNAQNPEKWQDTFTSCQEFFTSFSDMFLPYSSDKAMLSKMAVLQIGPGFPEWNASSFAAHEADIKAGIISALSKANISYLRTPVNNWIKSPTDAYRLPITQDYLLTTSIVLRAPIGLPKEEAIYYTYSSNSDAICNYSSAKLTFVPPADFNPVTSFWSVTVYQYNNPATTSYPAFTFTGNAYYDATSNIGRYVLANYTDSITNTQYKPAINVDGSVDIYFSQTQPYSLTGQSLYNNWLPLPNPTVYNSVTATTPQPPSSTEFTVIFRFYVPPESVIRGSWTPNILQQNVGDNTLFKLTP